MSKPVRPTPLRLAPLAALAATIAVGCGGDTRVFELVGTVERTTLELAAPVSEVVVEIPAGLGSRVEAGEIVVRLDTEVAEAELVAAQAALAAAEANVIEAMEGFRRAERLAKSRVGSTQDMDRARSKRDEVLAVVAERKARIAQAERRLNDLTMRPLVGGVVDQLPFEIGERVPAGGVVAVIQTDEKPWVRVWLPARAVGMLGGEAAAEVRIEGFDTSLAGRLLDVAREPEFTPHYALTERESAHLVYQARIALDEAPGELRPGLPARVRLRLSRPQEASG
jgi:HlyD family secretion protein